MNQIVKLYPHRASAAAGASASAAAARSIEMHCHAPKWVPDPFWSVTITIYLKLNLTLPLMLDARCGYALNVLTVKLFNYLTTQFIKLYLLFIVESNAFI